MDFKYVVFEHKERPSQAHCIVFVTVFLLVACICKLLLFHSLNHLLDPHADFVYIDTTSFPRKQVLAERSQKDTVRREYKMVCYYTVPGNDTSDLNPSSINPSLCTHINIGFAVVVNSSIQPSSSDDIKTYKAVLDLKKINPNLKVLLTIGGSSSDSDFDSLVLSDENRKKFASESLQWLDELGFDGLDVDWEFPSWPQGNPEQKKNFSLLLEELRKEINRQTTNITLLTVAVSASNNVVLVAYDVPSLAKNVDFINLMAYDFHVFSSLTPVTGANSPLFSHPEEKGLEATLNTDWSARRWNELGMPHYKIIIGIPTYGHSFTLVNEDNTGWNAPASGFGHIGQNGFVSLKEICNFLNSSETTHFFDDEYKVPFAFKHQDWISYENEESVILKAYYIKNSEFGGGMVYSLNNDDFDGKCRRGSFPLVSSISRILS